MIRKSNTVRQPKIGSKGMRIAVFVFMILFIIVADLFLVFDHEKTFSENENRMLQQMPELSMPALTSGRFMSQSEDFVEDQFFARDTWIGAKLSMDRLEGRRESNDIFLGKNGYLIEKPSRLDAVLFLRNLDAINAFAEKYSELPVVMTLVPPASTVCEQLLPDNAPCESADMVMNSAAQYLNEYVTFVDVTDVLQEHRSEALYYRSDHHWKSLAARYAFEAIAPVLGITDPVDEYAVMTVCDDFMGTLASSSGASYVKDSIELYVPLVKDGSELSEDAASFSGESEKALESTLEYVVDYTDTMEKSATIYDSAALDQKDKYQVFLGGNHPQINIRTNNLNEHNLLLIKDSYANAFVQFLLPYYSNIIIVDPRYYSDDLTRLIEQMSITEVLILYSENIFVTDNSLFGVLEDSLAEDSTTEEVEAEDTVAEDSVTEDIEESIVSEDEVSEETVEEEIYSEEIMP